MAISADLKMVRFVASLITNIWFEYRYCPFPNIFQLLKSLQKYQVCPNIDDCLCRLEDDNNLAVAVSRQYALNSPAIPKSHIYCFDDFQNINVFFISMHIRQNHHLFHQIEEIASRSFESGLFVKWTADTKTRLGSNRGSQANRNETSFRVGDLAGAIIICTCLMLTAILIFILEHIVHRMKTQRNPRRIWITLDKLIDGDRQYLFSFDMWQ